MIIIVNVLIVRIHPEISLTVIRFVMFKTLTIVVMIADIAVSLIVILLGTLNTFDQPQYFFIAIKMWEVAKRFPAQRQRKEISIELIFARLGPFHPRITSFKFTQRRWGGVGHRGRIEKFQLTSSPPPTFEAKTCQDLAIACQQNEDQI